MALLSFVHEMEDFLDGLIICQAENKSIIHEILNPYFLDEVRFDIQSNELRVLKSLESKKHQFVLIFDHYSNDNLQNILTLLQTINPYLPVFVFGNGYKADVHWDDLKSVHFIMNDMKQDGFDVILYQALCAIFPQLQNQQVYENSQNIFTDSIDRRKKKRDIAPRFIDIFNDVYAEIGDSAPALELVINDPEVNEFGISFEVWQKLRDIILNACQQLVPKGHMEISLNMIDNFLIQLKSSAWVKPPNLSLCEADINVENSFQSFEKAMKNQGYKDNDYITRKIDEEKWSIIFQI